MNLLSWKPERATLSSLSICRLVALTAIHEVRSTTDDERVQRQSSFIGSVALFICRLYTSHNILLNKEL